MIKGLGEEVIRLKSREVFIEILSFYNVGKQLIQNFSNNTHAKENTSTATSLRPSN